MRNSGQKLGENSLEERRVPSREADVERAAPHVVQRSEVSDSLSQLKDSKRVRCAGHVEIGVGRRGDDDEDARIRATLVQLPRGVQVPRSVLEHRGALTCGARCFPEVAEYRGERFVLRGQVRQQRQVVACMYRM